MSMNVFKYSVRSLIALTAYCLALVVGIGPGVASTVLAQGVSPPLPPTGLTVTLQDYHSVRISWDDPQNSSITGYQVLRRSRDGDTYLDGLGSREFVAIEDDTGTADTVYTDTSVSPQTRYVYRVKARNSAGLGEQSNYARAETPGVAESPTGLTFSSASHESVTIEWDDPQDDSITSYQVLRRSRDGDTYRDGLGSRKFVAIEDDTGAADTEYTDTSVSPETRYVYRVNARNPAGLSERSSYANAENTAAPEVVEEPTKRATRGGSQTAQQRSPSDVTLSSLTVDGATVPGVVPGATEFLFRVAESTRQVTLAATPRDSTSKVSYNTLDTDDYVEGHQVPLRVGGNSITITVNGQDTTTTAYYTLTINRASSALFDWAVLQYLEDVLGSGNDFPHGIWSDGTYTNSV